MDDVDRPGRPATSSVEHFHGSPVARSSRGTDPRPNRREVTSDPTRRPSPVIEHHGGTHEVPTTALRSNKQPIGPDVANRAFDEHAPVEDEAQGLRAMADDAVDPADEGLLTTRSISGPGISPSRFCIAIWASRSANRSSHRCSPMARRVPRLRLPGEPPGQPRPSGTVARLDPSHLWSYPCKLSKSLPYRLLAKIGCLRLLTD